MSRTFTIRAAKLDDLHPVTEFFNEHSRRLYGTANESAEDILQYWESPDVDFEKDVVVVEDVDGAIAGYGDIGQTGDLVWVDVRAFEEGPQRALIETLEAVAHEKAPGSRLLGFVADKDTGLRRSYEEAGYEVIRHSYRMEIELDLSADPGPPEGVVIRAMREGEEEQIYEVHEQSFEDAWMHRREPFEQWQHWFVKDPSFDASLWFVAEVDGQPVGVSMCRSRDDTEPGLGWVRVLGVLRSHRRRGIGEALLRHSFAEFKRRGFERVGLGVDASSPTGAVALYERAGMHVARTSLQLEKVTG